MDPAGRAGTAQGDSRTLTVSRLANLAAGVVREAFDAYRQEFWAITRRAQTRFEACDWRGVQVDAADRLDVYTKLVRQCEAEVRQLLAARVTEKLVWASMKAVYSGLIASRDDWELAETFYNSVTRRIFATVGVDPDIEFVDTDFDTPPSRSEPVCRLYDRAPALAGLAAQILADCHFTAPFVDLEQDAGLVAQKIEQRLRDVGGLRLVERAEVVQPVLYRGKAAYVVGRIFSGVHVLPLVLALINTEAGIVVDAVLLEENEVSILFSFARSYFHVDVKRPYDLVMFLRSIMPRKRIAELYIAIGFNKHGKTALYRDILQHLHTSRAQFEIARGEKGMVMTVFTMPDYDLVFKIIKDRFAYPKRTTPQEVRQKYRLVFRHDRAGRLVDAQEFEHLQFRRDRFSAPLLAELQEVAAGTVEVTPDHVVVHHAYVERRVTPLNLFISEADETAGVAAAVEYGNAIKDLAATNIFPGDLWLKNFGVTRHGRVVFYDYDELSWLTDCNFRRLPPPRSYEEELAPTPWFAVAENDVFPEEFQHFLGFQDRLRDAFMARHADLLSLQFWREFQERHRGGEIIHFFPYRQSARLQQPYAP